MSDNIKTIDPFAEAVEDRADELWPYATAGIPLSPAKRMDRRTGFRLGARWAHDYLAAQEPTDAECVAVLDVKYGGPVGPHDEPYDAEEMAEARAALSAARAALRDEEDTP